MADYWPPLAPRPASLAARRERVPPSFPPVQETRDVAPSPMMVSDFQSEPIRAIGGRLKIGAIRHRPSASSPIGGNGQQPKGQNFGGRSPPKVCSFGCSFGGGIRPGEAIPRFGEPPPLPLHRSRRPIRTGIDGRRLGESCSPSRFTSFPVLVRSSSAFPPMSCLEIRVGEPEFLNPAPRPARLRFDWGFFRSPERFQRRRGVPSAVSHRSPPSSVGGIAASTD